MCRGGLGGPLRRSWRRLAIQERLNLIPAEPKAIANADAAKVTSLDQTRERPSRDSKNLGYVAPSQERVRPPRCVAFGCMEAVHVETLPGVSGTPRKSGGPACCVCGEPAQVLYLDRVTGLERPLCEEHWDYAHSGIDGVFHELVWLSGEHQRFLFDRSASQVDERHTRMREALEVTAPSAAVLFDWTIDVHVEPANLRSASEFEWHRHQEIYRVSTARKLEEEEFWELRNEEIWLRRAMVHLSRTQGAAKRWQLELTPEPLTFCGWFKGDEWCGSVFADTKHHRGGGRSYWLSRCDAHRLSRIHSANR